MNEIYSLEELTKYFANIDEDKLKSLVEEYLFRGTVDGKLVLASPERHTFIAEVFGASDLKSQERLRKIFARLLEQFEPTNPPKKSDLLYLFYLLSLAPVIRSDEAKERLRRWLYINAFEEWKYGPFYLHSELVLATGAYNSDEDWIHYIKKVLPTRKSFSYSALAAYRVIHQTRGPESLSLVPDILFTSNPAHFSVIESMGYFLRMTISKFSAKRFSTILIDVLNQMDRPLDETLIIVVKLRVIIAQELAKFEKGLSELINKLDVMWNNAISVWKNMPPEDSYKVFDRTLEGSLGLWRKIPDFYNGQNVVGVFLFVGRYEMVITIADTYIIEHCKDFFENLQEHEQVSLAYAMG
jgi:hypothetical protein